LPRKLSHTGLIVLDVVFQDLRYASRQLRKSSGFALTAIFSLAAGIAATASVYSVVYGVLMNPYPYKNPERLVSIGLLDKIHGEYWPGFTGPQMQRLQRARSVESIAGMLYWNLTTTDGDLPEDVTGIYLTANAFDLLGLPALYGRPLIPSDAAFGEDPKPVLVLGYKFWQRHYGGDRAIVGHDIHLVHKRYTVVGIMPPRFEFGDGDVYLPQKLTADPDKQFMIFTRLRPGVTYAVASSELQVLIHEFAKERPGQFPTHFQIRVGGQNAVYGDHLGTMLFLLLSGVVLLSLIGCASVSILLLARGAVREHELAVRAALGASRSRILIQLLMESLLLSITGAFLGVLLASRAAVVIAAWLPKNSFPSEAVIQINFAVLLFSIGLAILTSVIFGLAPAISLSRTEAGQAIQANTQRATIGVDNKRTHSMLIAGQIAFTFVLMTTAGAAIGGFLRLINTSLGFDSHNTLDVGIPVHDNTYVTWEQRSVYFEQLRQRIQESPEVVSAAISINATPPISGRNTTFEIFGQPANEQQQLRANWISPEYFAVLHIPLRQGRLWNHAETMHGSRIAIVNESLARRYWPNGDAVGHQIRIPKVMGYSRAFVAAAPDSEGWLQIVGVVADSRNDGLSNPVKPAVYLPFTLMMPMSTQILVRTRGEPISVLLHIRTAVASVNRDQQVMGNSLSLDQRIAVQPGWAEQRLAASMFGTLACLGLVLAAIGLYSVVSYIVAQRTNEIGVRMSLGARQNHILRLIFASTATSVGFGVALGIMLSLALNTVLAKLAEGSSYEPVILLGVTALLVSTSVAATFFPARRACSVDPMIALHHH
jgi:predicted permease